jgi:hypothetical protein
MTPSKIMMTLTVSMVLSLGSLFAIGEKTAHHDLAWLGFLNLPKSKVVPSNLLQLKKPLELKSWAKEENSTLSWLPVAKYDRHGLVAKYYIKFNSSGEEKLLKRREK